MAGSICTMPNNGDSDWSGFVTIVEKTIRGYMGISMSNLEGTGAPQIEDGSVLEINGSVYQFTTAETITGWPSAAGTTEYIAAVPAGSTVTVIYTTTAPTWSGAKGGWYSGNNRYIGGCEWGGSATYSDKWIYQRFNDGGNSDIHIVGSGGVDAAHGFRSGDITQPFIITKVVEIGDWNMDAGTAGNSVDVDIDIESEKIRGYHVIIRNDSPGATYPLNKFNLTAAETEGGVEYFAASSPWQVRLSRRVGGYFANSNFNATSYNRGWITIIYDPNG